MQDYILRLIELIDYIAKGEKTSSFHEAPSIALE